MWKHVRNNTKKCNKIESRKKVTNWKGEKRRTKTKGVNEGMKGEERKYERRNGDGDINYQLNNLNVV